MKSVNSKMWEKQKQEKTAKQRITLELQPYLDLYPRFLLENYSAEMHSAKKLREIADQIGNAHEWFPGAREMKRKVIYHGGPTNSGKTKNAIDALKLAKNGIYCAPLRLLALEVHDKLLAEKIMCNLKTGQERQMSFNSTHTSCTIEMTDLRLKYDIAVIDEIQMIADKSRGHAWTNALLGLQADEIHLCGDMRA
jgi:ATP-dependent RNA helicase SUPV3L1/SUV3